MPTPYLLTLIAAVEREAGRPLDPRERLLLDLVDASVARDPSLTHAGLLLAFADLVAAAHEAPGVEDARARAALHARAVADRP